MALSYGATGLSAVVNVVFPDHTHLLFFDMRELSFDAYFMTFNSIDTMKVIKDIK